MARYSDAFAAHGLRVGQVLLTVDDVTRRSHYRNAYRTFARLLELGVVPIVNENDTVATTEIRFGDNDRLAALTSHLVHTDLLVLLSDVDGLYDGDPRKPGTTMITDVRGPADLEPLQIGRTGSLRRRHRWHADQGRSSRESPPRQGIPVVLTSAGACRRSPAGRPGRHALPPDRPPAARPACSGSRTPPPATAASILDEGAVRAVTERRYVAAPGRHHRRRRQLLGRRSRRPGLARPASSIARGLVNYDAAELPDLLGRSTRDLARELGPAYEREVVHRDDLVLL